MGHQRKMMACRHQQGDCNAFGRLAQMVERSLSMREVLGSIPRSSKLVRQTSPRCCHASSIPRSSKLVLHTSPRACHASEISRAGAGLLVGVYNGNLQSARFPAIVCCDPASNISRSNRAVHHFSYFSFFTFSCATVF